MKPIKANTVKVSSSTAELQSHLRVLASNYNQDYELMNKAILCESRYVVANHDGGRGKGVTGFWKTTFDLWLPRFKKDTGRTLNYSSQKDQIELMVWAFSKGEQYRNDWSSYNKLRRYGECDNYKLRAMGIKNIDIYPVK